ncbi:MAG: transposase, partial [Deltaproteobacteria bacterium]|nr:transposase [Deltaproteobacteria bacterium]
GEAVKSAGVLNADETGWRVLGKTWWLWCFCAPKATFYMINRSRGSPALSEFFTEAIQGILITDFWGAYNAVTCGGRQMCLPHLFRNIDATTEKDRSEGWAISTRRPRRIDRRAGWRSGRNWCDYCGTRFA